MVALAHMEKKTNLEGVGRALLRDAMWKSGKSVERFNSLKNDETEDQPWLTMCVSYFMINTDILI